MRERIDPISGKPVPGTLHLMGTPNGLYNCELHPEVEQVDRCLVCGAPQCCPACCKEAMEEICDE